MSETHKETRGFYLLSLQMLSFPIQINVNVPVQ